MFIVLYRFMPMKLRLLSITKIDAFSMLVAKMCFMLISLRL